MPLRVAVMGCVVNGPGEAREADLGVASGNGKGQIFVRGQVIKTVPESQIVETLIEEALRLADEMGAELPDELRDLATRPDGHGPLAHDHLDPDLRASVGRTTVRSRAQRARPLAGLTLPGSRSPDPGARRRPARFARLGGDRGKSAPL